MELPHESINFLSKQVTILLLNGHPYCQVHQICQNIGLDLSRQVFYIKHHEVLGERYIPLALDSEQNATVSKVICLTLFDTHNWLMSIPKGDVKNETVWQGLIQYKKAFYAVAHNAIKEGIFDKILQDQTGKLTQEEQLLSLRQYVKYLNDNIEGLQRWQRRQDDSIYGACNDISALEVYLNVKFPVSVVYFHDSPIRKFRIHNHSLFVAHDVVEAIDGHLQHAWSGFEFILEQLDYEREIDFVVWTVQNLAQYYNISPQYMLQKAQFDTDSYSIHEIVFFTIEGTEKIKASNEEFREWCDRMYWPIK